MRDPDTPCASSPVKLAERLAAPSASTLAAYRAARGLTQAQLAERVDVATKTVSGFERAKHLPSLVNPMVMVLIGSG